MGKEIFKSRLKSINMSQKEFAEAIGYSYQAIKQWKDEKIPKWAWMVINHLEDMKKCQLRQEEYKSIK